MARKPINITATLNAKQTELDALAENSRAEANDLRAQAKLADETSAKATKQAEAVEEALAILTAAEVDF